MDNKRITCIGGANIDRKAVAKDDIRYRSSNPVNTTESFGGVARNVAENLAKLGNGVSLFSVVGDDSEGRSVLADSVCKNIDVALTKVAKEGRTGTYTAVLDGDGEMVLALADMAIYDQFTSDVIANSWEALVTSEAIFMDTNLSSEAIAEVISRCEKESIRLYIDPVSSLKAKKLPRDLSGVSVLFPNLEEAEELSGIRIKSSADYQVVADALKAHGVENVVMTLGSEGIFYSSPTGSGQLLPYSVEIVDVTGAGDALTAGVMSAMIQGCDLEVACRYGLAAAAFALQTEQSVAPDLSLEHLTAYIKEN
ncbi:MAG: carbohydrate kinase family protein [Turicibacter sp.]|nr:carbohydrate kinase family protein [Turicibacter sp.]